MTQVQRLSDPFTAILSDLQPAWASYGHCVLGEPWALRFPESDAIRAHFILQGNVQLTCGNGDVADLSRGMIALLPFGSGHGLSDGRHHTAVEIDKLGIDTRSGFYRLHIGSDQEDAHIVCCTLHFDDPVASSLLLTLPELITVNAGDADDSTFSQLFAMIDSETKAGRIGAATLITRLVDIAVMRVLRRWMENAEQPIAGLKAGIRDPQIAAALASVHRSPDRSSSIDHLAEIAGLSRTVFIERFKRAMGLSPGRYVSDWRITVARSLLQSSSLSINAIAERLGYESESSFSRAFKKSTGTRPSQSRQGKSDNTAP